MKKNSLKINVKRFELLSVMVLISFLLLSSFLMMGGSKQTAVLDNTKTQKTAEGWSDDIRLTYFTEHEYYDSASRFDKAVSNNTVYIICEEYWEIEPPWSKTELRYIKSNNCGVSWTLPINFTTTDNCYSMFPNIAAENSNAYVVWQDYRGAAWEVYFKNSSDNGLTWQNDTALTSNDGKASQWPYIAANGTNLHIIWGDCRDDAPYYSLPELYYKRSLDGGATWDDGLGNVGQDRRLTFNISGGVTTSPHGIVVEGSTVHVIATRCLSTNERVVAYLKSDDNGANWTEPKILSAEGDGYHSYGWDIAVNQSNVHVVWIEQKHGGINEIYYRNSTDSGDSWNPEVRLTNTTGDEYDPHITVNGSWIWVSYWNAIDHCGYYRLSKDNGMIWEDLVQLTTQSGTPILAVSDGYVHAVFTSDRTGNSEIYYKRSPEFVGNISLIANPDILTADGTSTSTITAHVTNETGSPLKDLNVSFSIESGSGTLLSSYNYTDTNGNATVTYQVGTISGDVIINASCDGTWNTTIILIRGIPANISLTANPSILTADGGSTSLITATVTNETGSPVKSVNVNFTIESGGGSLSPETNITDENGNATTTYTAGIKAGDVMIKAVANGVSNTTTVTLIAGNPAHINVSASPNTITADGISNSTITVTVTDLYGNPVPNTVVYFVNETGTGSINPMSNTTNTDGITSTIYTSGTKTGNETINATCNDIWNTTEINLVAGPVTKIIIFPAGPINLYVGETQQFTAEAYDVFSNLNTSWETFWHVDGNIGIINNTGFFTAAKKGTGNVNCTDATTGIFNISTVVVLNSQPAINSFYPPTNVTIMETQNQTFNITASDIDNDTLTYQWYLNDTILGGENGTSYIFILDVNSSGNYTIKVVVSDGNLTVNYSWAVTVINVGQLEEIINDLQDQLNQMIASNIELSDMLNELSEKLSSIWVQLNDSKLNETQLQNTIEQLNDTITTLMYELNLSYQNNTELQNIINNLNQTLNISKEQILVLWDLLNMSKNNETELRNQIEGLNQTINSLHEQINQLTQEKENLKDERDEAVKDKQDLESKLIWSIIGSLIAGIVVGVGATLIFLKKKLFG